MKSLLLVGGVMGFGSGMVISLMRQNSWATCLWHGSVGAYVSAMLMRWWGQAWRQSLEQVLQERENTPAPAPSPVLSTPTSPKARS
jgi:uncharacterized membrane protein YeaQ/YmgE (transglycosylase-associated protein family)